MFFILHPETFISMPGHPIKLAGSRPLEGGFTRENQTTPLKQLSGDLCSDRSVVSQETHLWEVRRLCACRAVGFDRSEFLWLHGVEASNSVHWERTNT
jgi:hypothetical protein